MRKWFGATVGALLLATAGGAHARQEMDAGEAAICQLALTPSPQAVLDACTSDLADWPKDDAEYRAFALTNRANALIQLGRAAEAIADADQAIALRPQEPEAWAVRGRAQVVLKAYDKAIADLDRAIALKPKYSGAILVRGQAYLRADNLDKAIADAEQVNRLTGGYKPAWVLLVTARMAKGQYEQALKDVDAALAGEPDDHELTVIKGSIFQILGRADEYRALAEGRAAAAPLDPDALLMRAKANLRTGRLDEALPDLDKVIAARPNAAEALGARAILWSMKGDHAKALADADRLTALDRSSGFIVRGQVLANKGDSAGALAAYDAAVEAKPSIEAYFLRAMTWERKDNAKALADLDAALALNPRFTPARGARALQYTRLKRFDEALADADRALVEDPGNLQALNARVEVYDARDENEKLLVALDTVIPLAEPHASLFNLRCWTLATMGRDLDKALGDCKEAVKLSPTVAGYRDSLGMVHLKAGRWDQAIVAYDEALRLKPDLTESLFGRGLARLRKGLKAEGEADLAAARKLDAEVDARYVRYGLTP